MILHYYSLALIALGVYAIYKQYLSSKNGPKSIRETNLKKIERLLWITAPAEIHKEISRFVSHIDFNLESIPDKYHGFILRFLGQIESLSKQKTDSHVNPGAISVNDENHIISWLDMNLDKRDWDIIRELQSIGKES